MGLFARRRARATSGDVPFANTGGVPSLACLAVAAIEGPQDEQQAQQLQQPPVAAATVPTLAFLAAAVLMTLPTATADGSGPAVPDQQLELFQGTPGVLCVREGSMVDILSLSDDGSEQESFDDDPALISMDNSTIGDPFVDEEGLGDRTATLSTTSDILDGKLNVNRRKRIRFVRS